MPLSPLLPALFAFDKFQHSATYQGESAFLRGFGNGTVFLLSLKKKLSFLQFNVSIFGNIFYLCKKNRCTIFKPVF